jgi:hypothetical protein
MRTVHYTKRYNKGRKERKDGVEFALSVLRTRNKTLSRSVNPAGTVYVQIAEWVLLESLIANPV